MTQGLYQSLAKVLDRLMNSKQKAEAARDFDRLKRELMGIEDTVKDIETTIGPGGRVSHMTVGNVELSQTYGVIVLNPETGAITCSLEPDGDSFFGSNLATPGTTSLAIFSNTQDYNRERMGAGDVLMGDNSAGRANLKWNRALGRLEFRGGKAVQAWIGTDGAIYAGGGNVILDDNGIDAAQGVIAGWEITNRAIQKDGIVIDSVDDAIYGSYSSGTTGFMLNGTTGNAEFNNITARGAIKTSVFEKNSIAAYAGSLMVAKSASTLYSPCFVPPASEPGTGSVLIRVKKQAGAAPFADGDVLRLKNGLNSTWVVINEGYETADDTWQYFTNYWEGSKGLYYDAGEAVVDYGQGSGGWLYMSADHLEGPFYSVREWTGNPWTESNVVEQVRIGNLLGWGGIPNTRYGIGLGNRAAGNYLQYDPVDGFVIVVGNGGIVLDSNGLTIDTPENYIITKAINFESGDVLNGSIFCRNVPAGGFHGVVLESPKIPQRDAYTQVLASAHENYESKILLSAEAGDALTIGSSILIGADSNPLDSYINLNTTRVFLGGAVTVETSLAAPNVVSGFDWRKTINAQSNMNADYGSGFYNYNQPTGTPVADWMHWIRSRAASQGTNYSFDLAAPYHSDNLYFRRTTNNAIGTWRRIAITGEADPPDHIVMDLGAGSIMANVTRTSNYLEFAAPTGYAFVDYGLILPDSWIGYTLDVELFWIPVDGNGGTVVWSVELFKFTDGGGVGGATDNGTVGAVTPGANYLRRTIVPVIVPTARWTINNGMNFRLLRNGAHGSDTYPSNVRLLAFCLHRGGYVG